MPRLRAGVCAAILLLTWTPAVAAPKTDLVELRNGDRITCEIRKLERGKLTVKTDGIGTLGIEWDDIDRVSSAATYDIELASGDHVFGSLARGGSRTLFALTTTGLQRLTLETIVRISPVGGTLWRRLDGKIDGGFSFTEADVQTQWTLTVEVSYRSRHWLSSLNADSSLTSRTDVEGQSRNTLTLQTQRFLHPRWSTFGFVQLQQNEELSLDLRVALGGGFERMFVQSNRTVVSGVGGIALTQEQYADAGGDTVTEAVAGVLWDFFTFDGRSTSLDTAALTYIALDQERLRLELTTSFKSDIIGDLYWSINLFESYNSAPPEGRKSNDFGVSASVGWSF
jgi:hypothetical protein